MKDKDVFICTDCGHVEWRKAIHDDCPKCGSGWWVWMDQSTAAKIMTGLFRLGREGGEKK